MAKPVDFRRMAGTDPSIAQFYFEPWIDLPQDVMFKYPSLREWNRQMSLRWTDLGDKFQMLSRNLQTKEEE
jgi:hypothetical protein